MPHGDNVPTFLHAFGLRILQDNACRFLQEVVGLRHVLAAIHAHLRCNKKGKVYVSQG